MSRFSSDKRMLEYALNDACLDIFAFSTTRHDGISTGAYISLNCTPYTDVKNVFHNQKRVAQRLQELTIPWLTHDTTSFVIDSDYLQTNSSIVELE